VTPASANSWKVEVTAFDRRAEREVRRRLAREILACTEGFPATLDGYDFGLATGAPRQQITEVAVSADPHPSHGRRGSRVANLTPASALM